MMPYALLKMNRKQQRLLWTRSPSGGTQPACSSALDWSNPKVSRPNKPREDLPPTSLTERLSLDSSLTWSNSCYWYWDSVSINSSQTNEPQTYPFVFLSHLSLCQYAYAFFILFRNRERNKPSTRKPDRRVIAKESGHEFKANKNPEKMLTEKESLEAYLSNKLQRPVEVLSQQIPRSPESFRNGTLDLKHFELDRCSQNQIRHSFHSSHPSKNGLPHYQSVLPSIKDKKYQSIEELKNQPVAFASRSSTSGYLIPVWDLSNRGLVGSETALTDYFRYHLWNRLCICRRKSSQREVEAAAVSDYVFTGDNKYFAMFPEIEVMNHSGTRTRTFPHHLCP